VDRDGSVYFADEVEAAEIIARIQHVNETMP
jgi:hypothetical protein